MSKDRSKRRKPVIGLAGGIGAGKSTAARILESLGAAVIDSDRIAHESLGEREVIATLRQWWGASVLTADGKVDRAAVASVVFEHPAELARLEKLLYPRIARRREVLMAAHDADPKVKAIVLDSPKLFEAGLDELCDTVIFVDAEWPVCLRRLAESRGWTKDEVVRRKNLQNPLDTKKANADHIVTNNSGIDELRFQIERVFTSVLASFA